MERCQTRTPQQILAVTAFAAYIEDRHDTPCLRYMDSAVTAFSAR